MVNACHVRFIGLHYAAACLERGVIPWLSLEGGVALEACSRILVLVHGLDHLLLHLNDCLGIKQAISEIENVFAL